MNESTPPNVNQLAAPAHGADSPPVVHHLPARHKRPAEPPRMQVNLTSMIDVIFLLLIYFVVTASFAVGEGVITARLPTGTGLATAELQRPKVPLQITLRTVGDVSYAIDLPGAAVTNFADLARTLISLQDDPHQTPPRNGPFEPDHPILIKPDGDVRWQHVFNAFNAVVKARYTNVAFAAIEEAAAQE